MVKYFNSWLDKAHKQSTISSGSLRSARLIIQCAQYPPARRDQHRRPQKFQATAWTPEPSIASASRYAGSTRAWQLPVSGAGTPAGALQNWPPSTVSKPIPAADFLMTVPADDIAEPSICQVASTVIAEPSCRSTLKLRIDQKFQHKIVVRV